MKKKIKSIANEVIDLEINALKKLNPSTVSIYIYTQPVLASLFAIFSNSDTLDELKIISASIIFIGVYLVSVSPLRDSKNKLS